MMCMADALVNVSVANGGAGHAGFARERVVAVALVAAQRRCVQLQRLGPVAPGVE